MAEYGWLGTSYPCILYKYTICRIRACDIRLTTSSVNLDFLYKHYFFVLVNSSVVDYTLLHDSSLVQVVNVDTLEEQIKHANNSNIVN